MQYKTVSEIRDLYLNYFQDKGHRVVPSSSLIPTGDPTLLFTTAGMVQFKPYFTGAVELPFTKATSAQKCLRTTDLENVGRTERHCTFFEMLGNFSFGDYFKKESIHYALEFSTKYLGFSLDRIWITIFENDDEAKSMWMEVGIPEERIVRLGKKDNFWGPAGDSGACGPCSELYLDRGIEKGYPGCGDKPSCKPGCDCDRFMEYWNLVFNQFNQTPDGELHPLKQTGIDTGAGVERIALLLQEVDSVYDTDEFKKILQAIGDLSGIAYDDTTKLAFRVISDHSRSVFFAIGDSIYPDRTGRGYVIRRLIRRASLYARKLGMKEPFLYKFVPVLSDVYGTRYPELHSQDIQKIILAEEELFLHTLELGLDELEIILKRMQKSNQSIMKGEDSFRLYGTFGFPKEMTKELVEERGIQFDESSFEEALERDRALSRDSWNGKSQSFLIGLSSSEVQATEFIGYEHHKHSGKIIQLFLEDGTNMVNVETGAKAIVVLDKTVFYAESGGQIADRGYLKSDNFIFHVTDVQKENNCYLHIGSVLKGEAIKGMTIESEIDTARRFAIATHHSSTHLMHSALRNILGDHVRQKASLVSEDYLRFDFSHSQAMTIQEIAQVEDYVNKAIQANHTVVTKEVPLLEAKSSGAIAFFDEKYGDTVRIVEMGDRSVELCGGTHVSNTCDIQYFSILKESSPGAGNRRVEAICGNFVVQHYISVYQELSEKVQAYNVAAKEIFSNPDIEVISIAIPNPQEVEESFSKKGSEMVSEYRSLKLQLQSILEEKSSKLFKEKKKKEATVFQNNSELIDELISKKEDIGSFSIITSIFENVDSKSMKELADSLKSRLENVIVLFGSKNGDSSTLVFMCNQFSVNQGIHCGELLKSSMEYLGGKGGGKPDMAQGGGKSPEKLTEAIQLAKNNLRYS